MHSLLEQNQVISTTPKETELYVEGVAVLAMYSKPGAVVVITLGVSRPLITLQTIVAHVSQSFHMAALLLLYPACTV